MKFFIFNDTWKSISKFGDNAHFPDELNFKNKVTLKFRKYTDFANYLDSHQEFKNKVMLVSSNVGLSNKVIFNGVSIFVEGRGFV